MDHWFSADDGPKLAVFISAFVLFYLLARWVSSRSESAQPFQPPPPPPADPTPLPDFHPVTKQDEVVSSVVPSTENVTITLSDIWFDEFDAKIGPPDSKRFCAEMTLKISISDFYKREWEATYPVATPEGMRDKLQREHWSTMFLPDLLVVDHYDLNEICEALIDRLRSHDPDTTPPPQDSSIDSVGY